MSNVQLLLLIGAAAVSILIAAALPSGPSLMTDRSAGAPVGGVLIQGPGQADLRESR